MRLLVADVFLLKEARRAEGPGYLYVSGGTIAGLGPGEPPEEFQEAELVLGGEGRIAVPSASVMLPSLLETAVLRQRRKVLTVEQSEELSMTFGDSEAYYATVMALYELAMIGVGFVVATTAKPRQAVRAVEEAGLRAFLLVPVECGPLSSGEKWKTLLKEAMDAPKPKNLEGWGLYVCRATQGLESKLRGLGLPVVSEEPLNLDDYLMLERSGDLVMLRRRADEGVVGVGGLEAFVNPWSLVLKVGELDVERAFRALTVKLKEGFSGKREGLELGAVADFVIIDSSEPPGWLPDPSQANAEYLASSRVKVESLVVYGSPVVDGGMHMLLGPEKAKEASRALKGVVDLQ